MIILLLILINKSGGVTVNDDDVINQVTENPVNLNTSFVNWTTCEEFLEGTTFDEKKLLDIDWNVFYMWNSEYEDPYTARFRVPEKTLVDRFREEIEKNVQKRYIPKVNWNESAFFMESTIDLSALYFRTGTPGKFHVVSSLVFQHEIEPEVVFAMKIVEPGYFALMNCKLKVCVAFAPIDKMPKDNQIEEAAKLFKIKNPLGYSYTVQKSLPNLYENVVESNDDADDEEEMEIARHSSSLLDNIF